MKQLQKQFTIYTNIFLIIVLSFVLYGVAQQIKHQQEEEIIRVSSKHGNLRFSSVEEFSNYFSQEME